ncbi:MAG TPA: hypothetical protein VFZ32_13165 [Micromonosporaceae bacterium]
MRLCDADFVALEFAPYESDHNVLGAQVVATACGFVLTVVLIEGELLFEELAAGCSTR